MKIQTFLTAARSKLTRDNFSKSARYNIGLLSYNTEV